MKIFYDNVIFSLQKSGGVSVYWAELCKRIKNQEVTFFENKNHNDVRKTFQIKTKKESIIPPAIRRALSFKKGSKEKHIFHSSYYRHSKKKNALNIVTVHDFTHEKFGSGFKNKMLIELKKKSLKRATGIICQSESTKRDLLQVFPELSSKPIKVIYPGVDAEYKKDTEPFSEIENYVIFIGSRAGYKNFKESVRALQGLEKYQLIIIGGGELNKNELTLLEENLPSRYRKLSYITNQQLNSLYRGAHALLYPSLYEGFGIPVAEAINAGCPVITTNSSSLPEASGGNGILLDEPNSFNIRQSIIKLENDLLRDTMIHEGQDYGARFSWDTCYQETFSFYQKIYQLDQQNTNE